MRYPHETKLKKTEHMVDKEARERSKVKTNRTESQALPTSRISQLLQSVGECQKAVDFEEK